jgi:hypothetical protein
MCNSPITRYARRDLATRYIKCRATRVVCQGRIDNGTVVILLHKSKTEVNPGRFDAAGDAAHHGADAKEGARNPHENRL